MAQARFRPEERIGLIVAIAAHAAVIAALVMRPSAPPPAPPQRMEVTLSDDAGVSATSPQPQPAAADLAPTLGEAPAQPAPVPSSAPPEPAQKPLPAPREVHVDQPAPVPLPAPHAEPRPARPHHDAAKPVAAPANPVKPAKPAKAAITDDPIAAALAESRPTRKPAGGSRIGADFLKGLTSANTNGKASVAPAQATGPVKAALASAISRQLKPHWVAPQGVDADQLVTVLAFDLNPDGTLAGPPRVVRQEGIDDSNRPQAARHAEQAIRAVELAQPFQLPPEYYGLWKHVSSFRFDRNMSQ